MNNLFTSFVHRAFFLKDDDIGVRFDCRASSCIIRKSAHVFRQRCLVVMRLPHVMSNDYSRVPGRHAAVRRVESSIWSHSHICRMQRTKRIDHVQVCWILRCDTLPKIGGFLDLGGSHSLATRRRHREFRNDDSRTNDPPKLNDPQVAPQDRLIALGEVHGGRDAVHSVLQA